MEQRILLKQCLFLWYKHRKDDSLLQDGQVEREVER